MINVVCMAMIGKLYDNHNHSQFSFDGKRTSVLAAAKEAAEKGLGGICFTDHCDFFVPAMKAEYENLQEEVFDVEAQQQEIARAGLLVPSVKVLAGVEIGMYKACREQIRNFLSGHSFDQVTASVHYIDDTDPFYGGYYIGKDWKTAYGHYLETIYEEMTWLKDFDVMGHYDYVARYAPYEQESIFYRDFPDIFDAILKYLAEEGKALEINTKSYQDYKGRRPVADKNILIRYKELGGEVISLGSDSHDPANVGRDFLKYAGMVKECGFRYLAHFEKRRLIQETI